MTGTLWDNTTTVINTTAVLGVVKSDSPDPVIAGENLVYNIIITNNGPSVARDLTFQDAVSSWLSNTRYSYGWNGGSWIVENRPEVGPTVSPQPATSISFGTSRISVSSVTDPTEITT